MQGEGEQWSLGLNWVLFGVHGKKAWSSFFCEEGMTSTFKMGFLGISAVCMLREKDLKVEL